MISRDRRVFAAALAVPGLAPEDNIFIKSALGAQFTTQPSSQSIDPAQKP